MKRNAVMIGLLLFLLVLMPITVLGQRGGYIPKQFYSEDGQRNRQIWTIVNPAENPPVGLVVFVNMTDSVFTLGGEHKYQFSAYPEALILIQEVLAAGLVRDAEDPNFITTFCMLFDPSIRGGTARPGSGVFNPPYNAQLDVLRRDNLKKNIAPGWIFSIPFGDENSIARLLGTIGGYPNFPFLNGSCIGGGGLGIAGARGMIYYIPKNANLLGRTRMFWKTELFIDVESAFATPYGFLSFLSGGFTMGVGKNLEDPPDGIAHAYIIPKEIRGKWRIDYHMSSRKTNDGRIFFEYMGGLGFLGVELDDIVPPFSELSTSTKLLLSHETFSWSLIIYVGEGRGGIGFDIVKDLKTDDPWQLMGYIAVRMP